MNYDKIFAKVLGDIILFGSVYSIDQSIDSYSPNIWYVSNKVYANLWSLNSSSLISAMAILKREEGNRLKGFDIFEAYESRDKISLKIDSLSNKFLPNKNKFQSYNKAYIVAMDMDTEMKKAIELIIKDFIK